MVTLQIQAIVTQIPQNNFKEQLFHSVLFYNFPTLRWGEFNVKFNFGSLLFLPYRWRYNFASLVL